MINNKKLILGSASLGRRKVLEDLGYKFDILVSDIDEKAIRDDDPQILTSKLANAKADALLDNIKEPAILITSDQVVKYNGTIREKPSNEKEAREFLRSYALHPAEAINTVVVTDTETKKRIERSDNTKVYFKTIPDEIIDKLIAKGDIFKQAGGFSVNDPLVKPYVIKIDGETESLLGMPKTMIQKLLKKLT